MNPTDNNKERIIDFSSVLASSVHDMKNGLCLLIQSIENLSNRLEQKGAEEAKELAKIHYEASRLNTNLLQMLAMYRAEKDALPLHIDEHYLDELLEELIAKNHLYIENRNLEVVFEIEQDLAWYFDNELVANLLNDIFVNAMRYSKEKIVVTAANVEGQLQIEIIDDGNGYPESMLNNQFLNPSELDLTLSRTGLGLYFANLIATTHSQNDRYGCIELKNGGKLNGSVFTLTLP